MKIGYLQFEPEFGQVKANVAKALDMLKGQSFDLMVLPELFNTGYLIIDKEEMAPLAEPIPGGHTSKALSQAAIDGGFYIVAGLMEDGGGVYYNSAGVFGPKGYIGHYRKIHLYNEEKLYFEPGDRPFTVYPMGDARVGVMICFDWIFPESMRVLSILGADVIAHPANLVLPYCPDFVPYQCFDNRLFAVTANRIGTENRGGKSLTYTGRSQIAAPDGSVLHRAPEDKPEITILDIDPAKARDKTLGKLNDLQMDRRPEMYGPLTWSHEEAKRFREK